MTCISAISRLYLGCISAISRVYLQAIGRVRRFGQTHDVSVHRIELRAPAEKGAHYALLCIRLFITTCRIGYDYPLG